MKITAITEKTTHFFHMTCLRRPIESIMPCRVIFVITIAEVLLLLSKGVMSLLCLKVISLASSNRVGFTPLEVRILLSLESHPIMRKIALSMKLWSTAKFVETGNSGGGNNRRVLNMLLISFG